MQAEEPASQVPLQQSAAAVHSSAMPGGRHENSSPGSGPAHRPTSAPSHPSLVWLTTPSPQTPAIVVLELDVVGVDVVVVTPPAVSVSSWQSASALASAPR